MLQKTNNTQKILLVLAVIWLWQFKVQAQNGYPWMDGYFNASGTPTQFPKLDANVILTEGQTYYSDNDRAEVINYSFNGSPSFTSTITLNSASYRHGIFKYPKMFDLANNNPNQRYRYFLVQNRTFSPNANGHYTNGNCSEVVMVGNVDSTGGTFRFDVINPVIMLPNYEAGGSAVMQIVRVPCFNTFRLEGGIITCHAYDGHTGGFLAMRPYNFYLKSGIITVANKGYFPEDVYWAASTLGANGDNVLNNTLPTSQYRSYQRICPDTSGIVILEGSYGTQGDLPVPNIGITNATSGTSTSYGRQHTITFPRPVMGSAGYFISGQKSGIGGEGGGHGGNGGSAQNGNSGNLGSNGKNGGIGGAVGQGAKGGGIIMLKVSNWAWATGNIYNTAGVKLFYINGQNGAYGQNGGKGGNGGVGGKGAAGGVVGNTLYLHGGSGENGKGGKGGTGGDGSNGGEAGSLNITLQNIGGTNYTQIKNLTNYTAGQGGAGGQGGYEGTTGDPDLQISSNLPTGKYYCGGGTSLPPIVNICNCDSVFWAFSSGKLQSITPLSSSLDKYNMHVNLLNKYDVFVKKDSAEYHLWSMRLGGTVRSHCHLYKNRDCEPMFDKMKSFKPLPSNWGFINLNLREATRVSLFPLIIDFPKSTLPFTTALQWNGADGTLTDVMEPNNPICYKGTCDEKNPENRTKDAVDGAEHSDGDSAIVGEETFVPDVNNIGFYNNSSFPPPNNDNTDKSGDLEQAELYNQDDKFVIGFREYNAINPIKSINFSIINSIGQNISMGVISETNQWQISKTNLASGVYTLILNTNNGKFIHKFVIAN